VIQPPVVVIGAATDPHVAAVVDVVGTRAIVLDVESLATGRFEVAPSHVILETAGCRVTLTEDWRGWIRRLSPLAWETGTLIGSHDAAVKSSWLSLIAAIARHPGGRWLTDLETLYKSESKLLQYAIATRLGVLVPATTVTNDRELIESWAPRELIAKPLGPGHFQSQDGQWLTVFTEPFDRSDTAQLALLDGAPFIIQERIVAANHLRVVTVEQQPWVFRLEATDLPIDWREEPRAHRDWIVASDSVVGDRALSLAAEMGVGYSSQDWIVTAAGEAFFVDLNPAGQWLFLPEPYASQITNAIAEWMVSK
jgi:hypothetical protein